MSVLDENELDLSVEIAALQKALLTDEGYRQSWQANIACAIMDTPVGEGESHYDYANRCANRFLNYLTAGHPDDPISNMELPGMVSVAMAGREDAHCAKGKCPTPEDCGINAECGLR